MEQGEDALPVHHHLLHLGLWHHHPLPLLSGRLRTVGYICHHLDVVQIGNLQSIFTQQLYPGCYFTPRLITVTLIKFNTCLPPQLPGCLLQLLGDRDTGQVMGETAQSGVDFDFVRCQLQLHRLGDLTYRLWCD